MRYLKLLIEIQLSLISLSLHCLISSILVGQFLVFKKCGPYVEMDRPY